MSEGSGHQVEEGQRSFLAMSDGFHRDLRGSSGLKTLKTVLAAKVPDSRSHTNPTRLKDLALGWKRSSSVARVVRLDVRLKADG